MIKQSPKPDLKILPKNLRYAFLGSDSTYPVIISAFLTAIEEEKLLHVLRERNSALGLSISDIKGIGPLIVMHKILMEESYTPLIEHQ